MEAGFRDSLEQRDQKASWTYLVSLLPKRKRSLRLPCAKAKDGWQGRQAPPPSSAFPDLPWRDRKSTRLNSSHQIISYAVFCLKKKKARIIYRHPFRMT